MSAIKRYGTRKDGAGGQNLPFAEQLKPMAGFMFPVRSL